MKMWANRMILFAIGAEIVQTQLLGKSPDASPQAETCQFRAAIGLSVAF